MSAYADAIYAEAYFATVLSRRAAPWASASSSDRAASLLEATRMIDNLNFGGHKADQTSAADMATQTNQFPRGEDAGVPDEVKRACCELALKLLDDVDPELEMENLAFSQQGIGSGRVVRDTSYAQEHTRNGIPSLAAWLLLKPFLRDNRAGDVGRA